MVIETSHSRVMEEGYSKDVELCPQCDKPLKVQRGEGLTFLVCKWCGFEEEV